MSVLPDPRPTCYRCWKPESTCVCASITAVDNRTGVFVLQHPREHAHPIGTARFVELGLKRSQVVVADNPRRDLLSPLVLPPRTGLLFPRADARDLEALDDDAFPAVGLARDAGRRGGTAPAVYNAANEVCVAGFLAGDIAFTAIVDTVAGVLAAYDQPVNEDLTVDDVLAADHWARDHARSLLDV